MAVGDFRSSLASVAGRLEDALRAAPMESLTEYLGRNKPAKVFSPVAQYIPEGDCLVFYFKNDASYAHRVDDLLTLYRSERGNEIVGCEIKGIRCILRRLGDFGIDVRDTVDPRVIFGGYRLTTNDPSPSTVEELRHAAEVSRVRFKAEDLIPA